MKAKTQQPRQIQERTEQWHENQDGLGRLPAIDGRDSRFKMQEAVEQKRDRPDPESSVALERGWRYWNAEGWWGDQRATPHCVAYSWVHLLEDGPVTIPETPYRLVDGQPILDTTTLYMECQRNDEWEGTNYDGTSVRAGAKVLRANGHIGEYRWAFDVSTIINGLLLVGPVVLGTDWTMDMFMGDEEGFISPTGEVVGGHAYLLNGVNVEERKVRIKNSWGRRWVNNGHAWMTFDSLEKLLSNYGEACVALQTPVK